MRQTDAAVIKWRSAHHIALMAIFNPSRKVTANGVALWRKLVRIEREANAAACAYCNGEIDEQAWDAAKDRAVAAVAALSETGKPPAGFFVSGDPRGYTLKIDAKKAVKYPGLHRDWGGYGCLAAQID